MQAVSAGRRSLPVEVTQSSIVNWLGFWSASAAAVASVAFGIAVFLTLMLFPQTTWNGDIRAFAANYNPLQMALGVVPSILLAPAFLGLVVAIHYRTAAEKKPLTQFSLGLATLYVATVGINYFLQLTAVRQNLTAGHTEAMALFAMGNPQSVFWALEILGYFWQGAAAILMTVYFAGSGLDRWIRWMLAAVFVSGTIGVVAAIRGVSSFTDPVFAAGSGIWMLFFPAAMILTAVHFRRQRGGQVQ